MSFPFVLSLLLFLLVLADQWFSGPGFIASPWWRNQPYIAAGFMIVAVLLWLWVLAASRRRETQFSGPVESARGRNGVLQPILATIFLVVATNLALGSTVPRWLNFVFAEDVETERFTLAGLPPEIGGRCTRVEANHPLTAEVDLCLPPDLTDDVQANPGATIDVSGPASWFGLEPSHYRIVEAGDPLATGEPFASDAVFDQPIEPVVDATPPIILDAGPPSDKTGRAQRRSSAP